ncbi:uncharacterized protein LOC131860048 [Cryptomeria japonica]|uniref:uncharacterized protein LOC131860048 n=1 Tax=Cryptomeria japonica TaxID=3369 RepID=UPI0027D9D8FA|nr:uncharacterized protein LOC131860048 [Cryptomeria japonica]
MDSVPRTVDGNISLININQVNMSDSKEMFPNEDKVDDHCGHLEKVLNKALEFGVSLNPKKCHFVVTEGKFLGHIVSKEGVRIYLEMVEAINNVPEPKNVKGIQFFLGKVNFVRRFIANFAEIVKPIVRLLKKDTKFYWDEEAAKAFGEIKKAIQEALVLKSPNYNKPFSLFSFASYHTVATTLLQKDVEGYEHPIAFHSKSLQAAELKYEIMEKKSYALVKAIKAFRPYLVNAKGIPTSPAQCPDLTLVQESGELGAEHQGMVIETAGVLCDIPISVLFDSGASDSVISSSIVEQCGLMSTKQIEDGKLSMEPMRILQCQDLTLKGHTIDQFNTRCEKRKGEKPHKDPVVVEEELKQEMANELKTITPEQGRDMVVKEWTRKYTMLDVEQLEEVATEPQAEEATDAEKDL